MQDNFARREESSGKGRDHLIISYKKKEQKCFSPWNLTNTRAFDRCDNRQTIQSNQTLLVVDLLKWRRTVFQS